MSKHWITITPETEDSDAEYSLECDGVDSSCRLWTECSKCSPTEDQLDDGEWEAHGEEHQVIDGWGMVATNGCIVLGLSPAWDGPNEILAHGGPNHGPMPAGRYPVDFAYEGDGIVDVTLHQTTDAERLLGV